jgi:Na+/proline symporter
VVTGKRKRFDMVIVFVAFGILFGGIAAGFTLVSGGSILLAVLAYSGAGTVGALGAILFLLFFGNTATRAETWHGKKESGQVSA